MVNLESLPKMIPLLKRFRGPGVGGLALALLILILPPGARAQNDATAAANLKAQAQECLDALLAKNYAKVVYRTYPKVVDFLGGRDAMISLLETQMPALEAEGITFKQATLAAPETPVVAGDTQYVVVPQTVVLNIKGDEWEQCSYLLGISKDGGKTWTFVDGAGINQAMREAILPDLPVAMQLPFRAPPVRRTGK